ncbi:MAG: hypothetical protein FWD05_13510 [Oscillospiraceae bacterium]|nr:hypothetical protein [Oscillospiraceae bacterium]
MKKILLLILTLGLIFMLVACDDVNLPPSTDPPPSAPESPVPPPTPEPVELEPDSDEYEYELPEDEEEPDEQDYENANENDDVQTDYVSGVPLAISITKLTEDGAGPGQLADITFMHMLNYNEVIPDFGGTDIAGDSLLIQTGSPLRDFAVINITENIAVEDELTFIPTEAFGTVENFLPNEAFIINDYRSRGTLPGSGITFLDENDQRWFFIILQNQAYPEHGDFYQLIEFQLRTDALPADWVAPW